MSYAKYKQWIESRGTPRTSAIGGEIVLIKSDALKAVELLRDTNIVILGGDVYELESDSYFRPTYDNWYISADLLEEAGLAQKSKDIAYEYIKNYQEKEGLSIGYVLVTNAEN